jgi:hypothetical protein
VEILERYMESRRDLIAPPPVDDGVPALVSDGEPA